MLDLVSEAQAQTGKYISAAQAQALTEDAGRIRVVIGC